MIYFVGARGMKLIKIGYTAKEPDHRFASLQVGSPVELMRIALMQGDKRRERGIHRRYWQFRSHGEWFRDSPLIRFYIEAKARPWVIGDYDVFLMPAELKALLAARAARWEEQRRAAEIIRPSVAVVNPPEPAPPTPFTPRNSFDLKKLRQR